MLVEQKGAAGDRAYLWVACVLALCAGYYIAFVRLGAAIDIQHASSLQVATVVRANAKIVAARPAIEATEHALDAQMEALDIRADHATTVARFIREAARVAAAHNITVKQIDERRAESAERGAQRAVANGPFETIPLDVVFAGSYRDLLATIGGLTQAPVAMQIEIGAIEGSTESGELHSAPLRARLRVNVERLADKSPERPTSTTSEELHARSF